MTGPEHFREAEDAGQRRAATTAAPTPGASTTGVPAARPWSHSNACRSLPSQALRGHEGLPERDRKAWYEAAATKTAPAIAERTAERAA